MIFEELAQSRWDRWDARDARDAMRDRLNGLNRLSPAVERFFEHQRQRREALSKWLNQEQERRGVLLASPTVRLDLMLMAL